MTKNTENKVECFTSEEFRIEDGVLEKYTGERKEITIPQGIKKIGEHAFFGCKELTSVTIPDDVIIIGDSAFLGCDKLKSVTIANSVTEIGNSAFFGCTSLTSIKIPDSIMKIQASTFERCKSLKAVELPKGLLSIGDVAFATCISLTTILIPDGVKKVSYNAFSGCVNLKNISLPKGIKEINQAILQGMDIRNGKLKSYYGTGTEIIIPNGVKEIGRNAFSRLNDLESIVIPRSVTIIGYNAFGGCTKLKSITIPASVTEIGEKAFPKNVEIIKEEGDNKSSLDSSWEMEYIGRKIIPDKYDKLFDHNGYYYETEQYFLNNITVNIKPTVDEEGYITKIDSYKVKDKTTGHGRPRLEYRSLGNRDIKHFSKILDSVTEKTVRGK